MDRWTRAARKPLLLGIVAMATAAAPPEEADGCVPVPASWLGSLRAGDRIRLTDARGKRRRIDA